MSFCEEKFCEEKSACVLKAFEFLSSQMLFNNIATVSAEKKNEA
jgi:hypothetical protein